MKRTNAAIRAVLLAICLIITISCALTLAGCSKQEEGAPDGYKSASNEMVDYHLYVPEDWVVDTAPSSQLTSARVSEIDSTNISMMAYVDDDGEYESVDQYWSYYRSTLSGVFDRTTNDEGDRVSSFKIEKPEGQENDGENCLLGGAGAVKYVYTATLGGVNLKYMQIIALKSSTFYIFTFTASPDKFDEKTVQGVLDNFKFKD